MRGLGLVAITTGMPVHSQTVTGGSAAGASAPTTIAITDDTTTNATMFPVWVTTTTGNLPLKVTSTKLSFNPSTGLLSSTAFLSSAGVFSATVTGTGGASYGGIASVSPEASSQITIYVKSVTIKTSGSPADIATISVPVGISRYVAYSPSGSSAFGCIIVETAPSGSLGDSTIQIYDAPNAGGNLMWDNSSPGGSVGSVTQLNAVDTFVKSTSSTLYIYQTGDSANPGTCSFYVTIFPLP